MRYLKSMLVFVCVFLLAGCGWLEYSGKKDTLWIITEKSNSDGMNLQAEIIKDRFEAEHPDVAVTLEILPIEEGARELRLTQLRTQIMAGNGPDLYLMPTGAELISDEPERDVNIEIEPLFPDVQLAMRNGIFLDISENYMADSELQSYSLNQTVMDAGVLDGNRYVLPIRYNIPVIYTNPDLYSQNGLSEALFQADFLTIAETVLSLDTAEETAIGLKLPGELWTLGKPVSYDSGQVLLAEQEILEYLKLCQQRDVTAEESTRAFYDQWDHRRRKYHFYQGREDGHWEFYDEIAWPKTGKFHHECFNLLTEYTFQNYHWLSCGLPLYTGWLSDVLETIGVARITGQNYKIYPLRSGSGKTQASIAYWGAVGSSCKEPELAYAFLRQFFDEEFQGDSYRPRANREGPFWTWDREPQAMRLVEDSLPVRVKDCVPLLWNNLQYQCKSAINSSIRETTQKVQIIQREFVTAEDVPELDWQIDTVYFPVSFAQGDTLETAMEFVKENADALTEADIAELSRELYQNLWWHMAEG